MTGLRKFHLRPAGRTFGQAFDKQVGRLKSGTGRAQPNDQGSVPASAGGSGRYQPDPGGAEALRDPSASRGDQRCLGRRRRRARGQAQLQFCRIRHTDIGAGGIIDRGVQHHRAPRLRQGQRDRQDDMVLVPCGLEPLHRPAPRRGPSGLGVRQIVRARPVDAGRYARIPGRAPIGVPAGRKPDFEPGLDRRRRPGRLGRGDQPRGGVIIADPARRRGIGARRPGERQHRGDPGARAPPRLAAAVRRARDHRSERSGGLQRRHCWLGCSPPPIIPPQPLIIRPIQPPQEASVCART